MIFIFCPKRNCYLKAGTGYDCAGQNMEIDSDRPTAACLNWLSKLIFGATLPTGSKSNILKQKFIKYG